MSVFKVEVVVVGVPAAVVIVVVEYVLVTTNDVLESFAFVEVDRSVDKLLEVVVLVVVVEGDSTLQLQPLTPGVQFALQAAHHWLFS